MKASLKSMRGNGDTPPSFDQKDALAQFWLGIESFEAISGPPSPHCAPFTEKKSAKQYLKPSLIVEPART